MEPSLVFVGEQRSKKAISMGVRRENGRLAAKPLFEALRLISICPEKQVFINLYQDGSNKPSPRAIKNIRRYQERGYLVIGMGRIAQEGLEGAGIRHTPMTHPAARGTIRRKDRYRRHVLRVVHLARAHAQTPPTPYNTAWTLAQTNA